ncbi:MAG: sigma-70 family RNA polymerase sigma factor [Terracidiphilus sp.]|jgi:RNA polymerase sigma factor (TIGR02999 family)
MDAEVEEVRVLQDKQQTNVTQLLRAWRSGDAQALDQLMPLVYEQLRSMASQYMRGERTDHTLRATALVHEAYLKLLSSNMELQDRAHFLAIAAISMRRVLVDHAKANRRAKRGGGAEKVPWEDALVLSKPADAEILDLDAALIRLSQQDPRKGRLIELTYFGGLSCEEAAALLEVSTATINRDLKLAKAWLRRELK